MHTTIMDTNIMETNIMDTNIMDINIMDTNVASLASFSEKFLRATEGIEKSRSWWGWRIDGRELRMSKSRDADMR